MSAKMRAVGDCPQSVVATGVSLEAAAIVAGTGVSAGVSPNPSRNTTPSSRVADGAPPNASVGAIIRRH
jgi:hypothetical protein